MMIQESTIREFMIQIDPEAKKDPDFIDEIDTLIFRLKKLQKKKNEVKSKKSK